ncbi:MULTISPECIES: alpha/beta hydrolase family protein [unclassified Aureimonas]|uniref:alpha/beta hydrolase family protein n=1 Tax=unclassified Aureimonas TaxID=2615206 RepID=UPI00070220B7|nr:MULTISPECIES: alpha/beta hydrolase [unclassified Aureimonas]KQT60393.1 hypothetical protein ASG62_06995 [Aureimonas sp. Leaf427]KQT79271.1 hypothetical protein ASG54_09595 [Aureimonas sp. Leaf460]
MPFRPFFATLLILLLASSGVRAEGPIPPFKDDLFAYPGRSVESADGTSVEVDYSEARDIDQRDEVPERRVKSTYVDLKPLRSQGEQVVETPAGPLKIMSTGAATGGGPIVLFIHGRNGDRRLGMNDRSFGGNFNRLKNLMRLSDGLYVTADAGAFGDANAARIAALVEALGRHRRGPSVILACASMGGEFCWGLLGKPEVANAVRAVVMLSANSPAAKVEAMRRAGGERRIPLLLGHGTRDKVFGWDQAHSLYERLQEAGYPVRFVSFNDGNHGTPIRMIDWRTELNWLLTH